MVHADQAPAVTPFPPTPSLSHPPPELNELQRDRPVTRFRLAGGKTGRLVTRYEDVRQVPTDQPEHTRPRPLVACAITARRVEAPRPRATDVDADPVENL
ncbi:hypothetical protein [Streptomyces sp. NPDC048565]|uniref:hypothetical protein n=1 Tax=Streptomyces sp. NPDC048565 TaxID=3155266 RepID=UPI003430BD59